MRLPNISGRRLVKILIDEGFTIKSRRGSHITMKKESAPHIHVTIPLHKNIKKGTLLNILSQADVTKEELNEKLG